MNEYRKEYIALKNQFVQTEGNPDSVLALYDLKNRLEQTEDKPAKEVLVDVYDLLDLKKMPVSCSLRLQIAMTAKYANDCAP